MKAWLVARKTLREAWREPQLSLLVLIFPALMILIYYLAFGQSGKGLANYLTIHLDNQDRGPLGAQLAAAVRAENFDGQPVFAVKTGEDERTVRSILLERKAALWMVIPADFTQAVQSGQQAQVHLVGDPYSDLYNFAIGFLSGMVKNFVDQQTGGGQQPEPVVYEFLPGTGTLSDFQFGVPGVMVFGVLFGIISTAMIATRETVNGTWKRLRLSRMRAADLLLGVVLAQAVTVAVQLPLAFATALIFGFQSPGSLLLAVIIGMLLSLSATGLGFLSACFAHNDGEAATIGTLWMMPLVFLSGAIFPMPPLVIAQIGAQKISLYDLMPSTHAAEAMRRVLVYGEGPAALWYPLAGLALLSVLILMLGAWVYQRRMLRSSSL